MKCWHRVQALRSSILCVLCVVLRVWYSLDDYSRTVYNISNPTTWSIASDDLTSVKEIVKLSPQGLGGYAQFACVSIQKPLN